jgi:WYL domain
MLAREEAAMDAMGEVTRLADAGRVVRLGYRRPGDATAAEYLVEPYRLQRTASGPAVHAWQLSPAPEGRADGWRDFRLDRITSVADAGKTFAPRMAVTLSHDAAAKPGTSFSAWSDRTIAPMGRAEEYFQQLETAMLDGKVTPDEMSLAQGLRDRVEVHERKAVHARVFASVLHEVLQDGRISHREELYLRNVREFLDRLGWAP